MQAERPDDALSDHDLTRLAAQVIREPRDEPADSFVLHAPLELTARAALLPFVDPRRRPVARARIRDVAGAYAGHRPAPEPRPRTFDDLAHAARHLHAAIDAGDLDDVDASATWLGRAARTTDLPGLLADTVVPRLSAAAHGSILLYQLPRVAPRGELTPELLRPLARELARYPEWTLHWLDEEELAPSAHHRDLAEAIDATPLLGTPGSDFIYPIMSQVDDSGVAAALLREPLRTTDVQRGARTLLRAAAWAMLGESESRPYGWTHCLTLPQAVLGIAGWCRDPRRALGVAATYVVGFRAALASAAPGVRRVPDDPRLDLVAAIGCGPDAAAGAVWHAPTHVRATLVAELASRAAAHRDAHYVKYTLACLDAAAFDPDEARLYLAAAACLAGHWATTGPA